MQKNKLGKQDDKKKTLSMNRNLEGNNPKGISLIIYNSYENTPV